MFLSCKKFCPNDLRGDAPSCSKVDTMLRILMSQGRGGRHLLAGFSPQTRSFEQVIHTLIFRDQLDFFSRFSVAGYRMPSSSSKKKIVMVVDLQPDHPAHTKRLPRRRAACLVDDT